MCGIAGILTTKNPVSFSDLKTMTERIAHRGPDGDGHWINPAKNVGLGHRRLAIIDLSDDGKQPMSFANGRYQTVFNGEIYNYIELKERLVQKGWAFKSATDTEVLLALYHEKREKCLDDLDGMFAFVIWDEQEQTLFAARDRFGEKPFYYALHDGALYFASEMKALWAAGVPRVVKDKLLFNYLQDGVAYNRQDLTETFFENIYKLKAAHYFYVSPTDLKLPQQTRYWDINHAYVDENISEDAAIERFRELLFQSVERRLRSDVPVGSSLSGGLDSSLIVCAIDRLNRDKQLPQSTFSARFPGFARDEGRYMEIVSRRVNAKPHFVYPDENGLVEDFDRLFYHQEEPFGSASIYAQFCVMRLAKESGVTVLLDGQGADELLAGYHFYFVNYFRELKTKNRNLWKTEKSAYSKTHSNGNRSLKRFVADVLPEPVKMQVKTVKSNVKEQFLPVFNRDYRQQFQNGSGMDLSVSSKTLQEYLYWSALQGDLEELLRYADRNSMAHSREVRLPFLSHELAEFLFSLPANFKIRNGTTKFIMRQAFADILPREIIERQDKIGYEPPQNKWLKLPKIIEKISDAEAGLISRKILHPNFARNQHSPALIWKVLMADSLLRQ